MGDLSCFFGFFFENQKKALTLEKKTLMVSIFVLHFLFSIQNVALRVSRKKIQKVSLRRVFFLVFLTNVYRSPSSTKLSLPRKIWGRTPAFRHYSFCKTSHYKCLTVSFISCISWGIFRTLSNPLISTTLSYSKLWHF